MAKLFKVSSQWASDDLKDEWYIQKIFRKVFRRPKLKRVSEFDNGIRRAINAQSGTASHHSSARPGQPAPKSSIQRVLGSRIDKSRLRNLAAPGHRGREGAVTAQTTASTTEPTDIIARQDVQGHKDVVKHEAVAALVRHAQAVELLEEMENTTNNMLSECREMAEQIARHRDEADDAREAGPSANDEILRQAIMAKDALQLKLKPLQASYWNSKSRLDIGKIRLFEMLKADKIKDDGISTAEHPHLSPDEPLRERLFGTVQDMDVSKSSKMQSITDHWRTEEILTYLGKCLSAGDILKGLFDTLDELIVDNRHLKDQQEALSVEENEARDAGKVSQDGSLARILLAKEDLDRRGNEMGLKYAKAEEDYERVKTKLYHNEHLFVSMLKHEIEAVGMKIYLDSIAQVDVEALREELLQPPDPAEGEEPSNPQSEEQVDEDHSGKSASRQKRDDAWASLSEANNLLVQHRAGYNMAKAKFRNREDVELDGLSAIDSPTQEDFDRAFLRQGMRFTRQVREAEDRMWEAFEEARDAGVTAMSDQCFHFPDDTSEAASEVPEAPEARILAWSDQLPAAPPHPEPDDVSVPDSSPITLTEPDMWESLSCVNPFLENYVARVGNPKRALGEIRPSRRMA